MALSSGSRLGVYQITAPLGEGGMGQVWRARDTKLDRDVAIKVLPEAFAHDADRLARFTREAKTLAALNHPHIAAIYGLEESAGVTALVMELVEGDDLSQRIARGAIPIDEALPIAKQIAEALEAAHEQGIIHRDLKPANIKVRADGTVKVLDFGLAKALDPAAASSPAAMNSPTITSPAMTQAGMILGTAAYMAPEQAKGKAVDKRADIWAFGVVLYEMLTGQRLFSAETIPETLAYVMTRDVDLSTLPPATPRHIRTLLAQCLVKDPKQRLRDMGDARLVLSGAHESEPVSPTGIITAAPQRAWPFAALGLAAAVIAAMALPTLRHLREAPPPVPPETRLEIVTPSTGEPTSFALSPDGRQIVFTADSDGASRLWLRPLAATTAQPLAGTEGASLPFWSPNSQSLGFFAGTALKRLDLAGGAPQTLATVTVGAGGTWHTDDVILFAPSTATPLMRVAATGGTATAVTALGASVNHAAPQFLPDGRFLFSVFGAGDDTGLYVGALDGRPPMRLVAATSSGAYLPSQGVASGASATGDGGPRSAEAFGEGGWLLWLRPGTATLVAQRLDLATTTLVGEPVPLAEGVDTRRSVMAVSGTPTGLVAYRRGDGNLRQLTWVDRSGTSRGTVGPRDATLDLPSLSPDGRRVAVARTGQGNIDIWLLDGLREGRFTVDPQIDRFPVWSADGTWIAFSRLTAAGYNLYQQRSNGAGEAARVVASDQLKFATSWSTDGRFLLFNSIDPQTNIDIWVVEPGRDTPGDRPPPVWLKTPFREGYARFSPDGRWVAYQSNDSGRPEIYVRPFVPPSERGSAAQAAERWQISVGGGIHPVWRHDGKELFYLSPAGEMMAAPIATTAAAVVPGVPVALFPTRVWGGGIDAQQARQYDVAPDGRFLINTVVESAAAPITLILNWNPEAKK